MNYEISSKVAYDTAHYCLLDTLGCGLEALEYPACKKLLGPIVPAAVLKLSNTRHVKNCLGHLFLAPSYTTACASPELSSSSTPPRRHLTSAR